jgi:hypothetical protein
MTARHEVEERVLRVRSSKRDHGRSGVKGLKERDIESFSVCEMGRSEPGVVEQSLINGKRVPQNAGRNLN